MLFQSSSADYNCSTEANVTLPLNGTNPDILSLYSLSKRQANKHPGVIRCKQCSCWSIVSLSPLTFLEGIVHTNGCDDLLKVTIFSYSHDDAFNRVNYFPSIYDHPLISIYLFCRPGLSPSDSRTSVTLTYCVITIYSRIASILFWWIQNWILHIERRNSSCLKEFTILRAALSIANLR